MIRFVSIDAHSVDDPFKNFTLRCGKGMVNGMGRIPGMDAKPSGATVLGLRVTFDRRVSHSMQSPAVAEVRGQSRNAFAA